MRLEATRSLFRAFRFQSTHPARGATQRLDALGHIPGISIHAPREGCDRPRPPPGRPPGSHFNPRTPRGVRLAPPYFRSASATFQSTHPARGATAAFRWRNSPPGNFNPRTPRGVRPVARTQRPGPNVFQSTHPARGATSRRADMPSVREFQSTHPARGATSQPSTPAAPSQFQSTHPARGATVEPGGRR